LISLGGPSLGAREKIAVWRQIASGQLAQGPKVALFEKSFSEWIGVSHSIALNSGTSALHLGILSLGIGAGDEVIVPSFTFAASANAVALTGAKPVFCDVEPEFFTIDPALVERLITSATKAIMAVHLYGQMANVLELKRIADKHGLFLIEDAAQAHGAQLSGLRAGAVGDFSAFSFYPTKNMTTGEGGMITTNNTALERSSRLLRNQGMIQRYQNEVVGFNNRMTEINAAIGLVQLTKIDAFNTKRIRNAQRLASGIDRIAGIRAPRMRPDSKHVFHQFTVLVEHDREEFQAELGKLGVQSAVYYPTPVHKLQSFQREDELPVTEELARTCLSLPIHPGLSSREIDEVANAIRKIMGVK